MSSVKLLAALALLTALGGPTPARAQSPSPGCEAGDLALVEKKLELAREEYEKCLKTGPPNIETLSNLGIVCAQLGQFERAIDSYKQALALSPENSKLRANLGLAYLKTERYEEAAREFAHSLLADPGDMKTLELLAFCHYNMKRYELAAYEVKQVLGLQPREPSAAFLLGSAYLKLNRAEEAVPLIDFALRQSGTVETHLIMGQAYLGVHAYREAINEFQKAEALRPGLPGLHDGMGTAYSGLGNADLASAEYQMELARDPNDFEANYYLGRLKRVSGDLEAAQRYMAKASQLRPDDPAVDYEYAVYAVKMKDFTKAQALLERVLTAHPNYTDAHVLLAEVFFKVHRLAEAEREKAIVFQLEKAEQARQKSSTDPPSQ
jgi:Flp pilus assembly protein TadD